LKGKKHLKAQKRLKPSVKEDTLYKEIFLLEVKINRLAQLLEDSIIKTKTYIEKKQARTVREIYAEMEQDSEVSSSESEEEERGIKNYPTGWDGEPIPYWLYKLHGLGVEYKCEICGNTSYWGRRAFERHFTEWRHAHGMRCLQIPNSEHFREVTRIQDAIDLYKKIQGDLKDKSWVPADDEEFEDKEGNVMSKKVYADLKRQGLAD